MSLATVLACTSKRYYVSLPVLQSFVQSEVSHVAFDSLPVSNDGRALRHFSERLRRTRRPAGAQVPRHECTRPRRPLGLRLTPPSKSSDGSGGGARGARGHRNPVDLP